MISTPEALAEALEMIFRYCDAITAAVYAQATRILTGDGSNEQLEGGDGVYPILSTLLNRVLKAGEFQLFEKLLNLYNHMESNAVLIHLAGIYLDSGYQRMAAQHVLRSIKELDYLDDNGIDILSKTRTYL